LLERWRELDQLSGARDQCEGGVLRPVVGSRGKERPIHLQQSRALHEQGYEFDQVPTTVELDHRNHAGALNADAMKQLLGLTDRPMIEADSATGAGIYPSLESVAKQVLHILIQAAH
jgi:hypothetical protein